jgi:hypothetical protein
VGFQTVLSGVRTPGTDLPPSLTMRTSVSVPVSALTSTGETGSTSCALAPGLNVIFGAPAAFEEPVEQLPSGQRSEDTIWIVAQTPTRTNTHSRTRRGQRSQRRANSALFLDFILNQRILWGSLTCRLEAEPARKRWSVSSSPR